MPSKERENKKGQGVILQSVDRALELIAILARNPAPMSVAEISQVLDIPRTTAYGLTNTLLLHDFIEKDPLTNKFIIGWKFLELGGHNRYRAKVTIIQKEAEPLIREWDLSVHAGTITRQGNVLFILVIPPITPSFTSPPEGFTIPAHATGIGKVLLAFMPEDDTGEFLAPDRLQKMTRNTITDPSDMLRELSAIRAAGYAVDREEAAEGISCVAAPIRDYSGRVTAAVSISGPASRIRENEDDLIRAITAMSGRISRSLGWSPDV